MYIKSWMKFIYNINFKSFIIQFDKIFKNQITTTKLVTPTIMYSTKRDFSSPHFASGEQRR